MGQSLCRFCATPLTRSNATREHVIPRWTRKLTAVSDHFRIDPDAGKVRWSFSAQPVPGTDQVQVAPTELPNKHRHPSYVTVPVCAVCNNGWLSDLEQQVIPVITPLAEGDALELSPDEAQLIARWVAKTAIAFEADDPERAYFSASQIRDVVNGRVPRSTVVFMARWSELGTPILRHSALGIASSSGGAFSPVAGWGSRTFFSVGHAVFYIAAITPAIPAAQLRRLSPLGSQWVELHPTHVGGLPGPVTRDTVIEVDTPVAQPWSSERSFRHH